MSQQPRLGLALARFYLFLWNLAVYCVLVVYYWLYSAVTLQDDAFSKKLDDKTTK